MRISDWSSDVCSSDLEEASKCIAMGRHTASVFHSMRMLEIAIKALAKRLGIEDPTKPAEKNWAFILNSIRKRIDELWPPKGRVSESEGAAFEIGRASWRERVCLYVEISGGAVA